jgi:hypothetical protein
MIPLQKIKSIHTSERHNQDINKKRLNIKERRKNGKTKN